MATKNPPNFRKVADDIVFNVLGGDRKSVPIGSMAEEISKHLYKLYDSAYEDGRKNPIQPTQYYPTFSKQDVEDSHQKGRNEAWQEFETCQKILPITRDGVLLLAGDPCWSVETNKTGDGHECVYRQPTGIGTHGPGRIKQHMTMVVSDDDYKRHLPLSHCYSSIDRAREAVARGDHPL